jgi:uncharacterized protein (TIRG00374 family)
MKCQEPDQRWGGYVISPRFWVWARLTGGAASLVLLLWWVGVGPFVDGLRQTTAWAVVAAGLITAGTTLCCAWRWRLVASGLGLELSWRAAIGAYYRSQFLNSALPGGILGDVHRGVRHGRGSDDLGRGLRSVAWDRISGQSVQLALTGVVLLVASSRVGAGPLAAVVVLVCACAAVLGLRHTRRSATQPVGRASPDPGSRRSSARLAAVASDFRQVVLRRAAWPGIVISSTLALAGYVCIFAVALTSTGTHVSEARLIPMALVVLLAGAIPTNVAGWGPREGAAAWAFAAAGLGAAQGVTVSVVYGVLILVATVPGAVLLIADRRRDMPPWHRGVAPPAVGTSAERDGGTVHA